ncbi:RNA polymerase sigma factor [Sulfurifustis variabilis]|uniref:RNA polymerase sigma factor n=2 Tax=Sulfurifustis variabilis TaxID=1675686 RepID=A0A1B4V4B1_9GAMM|nr:RNA polymerase sigma factor [Sulfurifustis variabilis]
MRASIDMVLAPDDTAAGIGRTSDEPDEALVARVRAGDVRAYALVVRRYNRRLFRIARSILRDDDAAQDAMQEAYIRAYLHLDTFRAPGNFAAWLARITVNEALMRKRKDQRYTPLDAAGTDDERASGGSLAPASESPEASAGAGELRRLVEAAVDRLPEGFRTVFVLRAIEQLSVEETAACLGVPETTVKTRFHRARLLMQQALHAHVEAAGREAFDFAGPRCDRMVAVVLARLANLPGRR